MLQADSDDDIESLSTETSDTNSLEVSDDSDVNTHDEDLEIGKDLFAL